MKKIKVLHTEWSSGWGGQEIRILSEMELMRSLGCEVSLACKADAKIAQRAKDKGFEVFILPFSKKSDFKTMWLLRGILKQNHFDIINTHSGIDSWCGGLASVFSGAKFIRTRHLSNKIHPSRLNFINELADFVMTTGESVKDAMIRNNRIKRNKIQSVPTGINTEIFDKKLYNKGVMREKYGIPQDKIVIGNLGVMREFKRQDIFIEVAQEIHVKYPNTYFVIAGSGDGWQWINGLVNKEENNEFIKLLGHVENPAEFLSTLDIFMLTSDKNEGVPQSLIQALAMELPCIASDIGSICDLHCKNEKVENFILTKNPIKEEFYIALEEILEDKDKILPNRDFIIENFSLAKMGEKIMGIYKELLNGEK